MLLSPNFGGGGGEGRRPVSSFTLGNFIKFRSFRVAYFWPVFSKYFSNSSLMFLIRQSNITVHALYLIRLLLMEFLFPYFFQVLTKPPTNIKAQQLLSNYFMIFIKYGSKCRESEQNLNKIIPTQVRCIVKMFQFTN